MNLNYNFNCISEQIEKAKIKQLLKYTWRNMINRCYCKTCPEYKYYGALGVSVCALKTIVKAYPKLLLTLLAGLMYIINRPPGGVKMRRGGGKNYFIKAGALLLDKTLPKNQF